MRYQCVIFDMDGTILDTLDDLKDGVNHALTAFQMPCCTREQIRRYLGNGAQRLVEQAVPEGTDEERARQVLACFKEYYGKNCRNKTEPYPGVLALMSKLRKRGVRLAVVSNKPDFAVKELADSMFPGLLELAIGQKDQIPRKPAPDMLELCMKLLGASKTDCVYVGDSEVDLLTASNTGIDCICVTWGFRTMAELEAAGAVCFAHTIGELETLL